MSSTTERKPAANRLTFDRRHLIDLIGENGFIIIFVLWCLYLSLATHTFLTVTNLTLVLRQSAIIGIVAYWMVVTFTLDRFCNVNFEQSYAYTSEIVVISVILWIIVNRTMSGSTLNPR